MSAIINGKKTVSVSFSPLESGEDLTNRWYLITGITCLLPVIIGLRNIKQLLGSPDSWLYLVALVVFVFCVVHNHSFVEYLAHQFDVIKKYRDKLSLNTDFGKDTGSLLHGHVSKLECKAILSGGKKTDQDTLVEVMTSELHRKNSTVVLCSNILITFGLVGTILGMIGTLSGLEGAFKDITNDSAITSNMKNSLGNMSNAFYTTLICLLFGGIILRVLCAYTENKADKLVSVISELVDVRIIPLLYVNNSGDNERVVVIEKEER